MPVNVRPELALELLLPRSLRRPHPRPSEPYVRLATHTAQASTNATRGTQLIPPAFPLLWICRGNARATTPSCRTAHHPLDFARPDGGCARAARRPEVTARTSR